ncbi:MAG: hypothetical protein ACRDJP_12530, partial [Actinomycetota bacterium]
LVDEFVAAMLDALLANLPLIGVMADETPSQATRDLYGDAEAQVVDIIAAGLSAGIEAGAFETRNPRLLALLLLHAAMCTIEHFVVMGDDIDRDELVATTQELARKALAPRGPDG